VLGILDTDVNLVALFDCHVAAKQVTPLNKIQVHRQSLVLIPTMTDIFELNCITLGDDSSRVFIIKISKEATVDGLKKAIKVQKAPEFDDLAADSLRLWKVCDPYYPLHST
jgi:hypothetical protein